MKPCFFIETGRCGQEGFALLATLLILSLLTVIGLGAIKTTSFELKLARNDKIAKTRFLGADSGWQQAGPYLDAFSKQPDLVNLSPKTGDAEPDFLNDDYYKIVRNFGNGGDGELNASFSPGTQDGKIGTPYWYRLIHNAAGKDKGSGPQYLEHEYKVVCNAGGSAEVEARLKKTFRHGYK